MARDFRPARVYQTAKSVLATVKPKETATYTPPLWLKVVEAIPPTELLTRPVPVQHQPANPKARKPKKLYKPQQIVYEEDQLRKDFFRDHPWELARPRIIIEMDGLDYRRVDWSRGLRQPGVPLSGESVVQRQLWLMHNVPEVTKEKAYDQARREFYALRQEEEVERRIAQEEARMVGAYFGKSRLQVGMDLEDKEFEKWKGWARTENAKIEAQRSSMITSFGDDAEASADAADPELEKID